MGKLPMEGSKKLLFVRELTMIENHWVLKSVNNVEVVPLTMKKKSNVSFKTKNIIPPHVIHLEKLYPSYPKVSGVDILQFIMTLGFVCKRKIILSDESDLSIPYNLLYGKSYYFSKIKGISNNLKFFQNQIVEKKTFLDCASLEFQNVFQFCYYRLSTTLSTCETRNISVDECPLGYIWLGELLYKNIFHKCIDFNVLSNFMLKNSNTNTMSEFKISNKDLDRILNKRLPKPQVPYVTMLDFDVTIPKTYNMIQIEFEHQIPFFQKALIFTYEMLEKQVGYKPITALQIFKIFMPQLIATLNYLWKYACFS